MRNEKPNGQLRTFLRSLHRNRSILSRHTLLTLRGQALGGDIEGAKRGLARLLMYAEQH